MYKTSTVILIRITGPVPFLTFLNSPWEYDRFFVGNIVYIYSK